MLIGILTLAIGAFALASNHESATRFWAVLLQNSVFFLLISVASIFILAASTLGQGGWIVAWRRVPEAIATNVWILGIIAFIVMMCLVFGNQHEIYHWVDAEHVKHDPILSGKSAFLSPQFYTIWTVITIFFWGFIGWKMRQLSLKQDAMPQGSTKVYWLTNRWAAGFIFCFALTLASVTPWLWLMSIDAHWYSTMYSWYVFASSFVSGMAMITLFVIFLKNRGYLKHVNSEHIHDLGKLMFAFSIFWTYLWFSQFMLIWYANIPEETVYFKPRLHGPYQIFFWSDLIINFVLPLLILMSRPAKRNYFTITLMAVVILIGHWIDFYQMVMPSPMGDNWHFSWFELGIPCGFIGLIMLLVGKTLAKAPLVPQNHPFLKETIIHQS
jgi:hypothetical protein